MKNEKHLYKLIYKTLPALLILFTIHTAVMPETAWAKNSPAPRIKNDNQDDFDKKFREGRDLIDKGEWAKAAEKFREVSEKYPDNKLSDAALYWLAFCSKKQKQFEEANAALDRLIEKFPASPWISDARVMRMEVIALLGRISPASAKTTPNLYEALTVNGVSATAPRAPLDREDEIKIAAFQSLLTADPKRAITTLGEILKSDSKATETFKTETLRVLRSPRRQRTDSMIYSAGGDGGCGCAVAKEFLPSLRETLVKSFESEKNGKIRKEIIYALASLADDPSTEYLKKLYAAEDDLEMKRAIINSFVPPPSSFYAFETNAAPKRKIETDFLWEIVRAEKDSELRVSALTNLQRFPNWAAGVSTTETLSRLYDAEADEQLKISIIRAIVAANRTGTGRKLLDIAKNDRSDKLRLEAIYHLRNSKDPEVLKFLESLIK